MLRFKFIGHLRRYFSEIELVVDTPAQGLRLLLAQDRAFKKAFLASPVQIRVDGDELDDDNARLHMDRQLDSGATITFVPVVEGAGLETGTIVAIVAITMSVASVAYSLYMSRNMKTKTSAEAAENNTITNNSFTSTESRIGQGHPVPLLLGEMVVAPNVVSLGIDTSNNQDWDISIS
ncbi:MAG: lambda tail assembly [Enterobacteriaceae bacterium]|jgi:predicted phage tail protein|nr:lambda tail assembly [Enterobacteriaceae bacterium]